MPAYVTGTIMASDGDIFAATRTRCIHVDGVAVIDITNAFLGSH
jgi:hypothetical protein